MRKKTLKIEEKEKDKMKLKFNDLHGKIGSLKNEFFYIKNNTIRANRADWDKTTDDYIMRMEIQLRVLTMLHKI